jgi:hypothetical protein
VVVDRGLSLYSASGGSRSKYGKSMILVGDGGLAMSLSSEPGGGFGGMEVVGSSLTNAAASSSLSLSLPASHFRFLVIVPHHPDCPVP